LASLAQQVQRLKAAVAVRQRGSRVAIRVIDEDPDEVLDRMIEAGDITEAQRDQVMVIERVIVVMKLRLLAGMTVAPIKPVAAEDTPAPALKQHLGAIPIVF
jgi:hypothetical protein